MITPVCKSCLINEGSVFAVFESTSSIWADDPKWTLIYCDDCWTDYLCRAGPRLKNALGNKRYITKEDYLAALAMAEL